MGRKIRDILILIIVAAGCLILTLSVSGGAYDSSTMIYNLVFWAIIVVLYLIAVLGGFFRMSSLSQQFAKAVSRIEAARENENLTVNQKVQLLKDEFPMEGQLDSFLYDLNHSQSGICDIEDYINEEETDRLIHKRMLDLIPDVMTSLGILGTFMGLVWGLREFEPSNYEAMTASVTSLVDGIKVAFLTSIYGLSMSLTFSYSMKNGYSVLMEQLNTFIDRFHMGVVPSAEMEAQNRLVNSQKEQNELLKILTSDFSDQVAHGFAASLTPTLDKINMSLGNMMVTITKNQEIFLQEIVQSFVSEMKKTFHTEFDQFGKHMDELNEVVSRNIIYTEKLYQNMCSEMNSLFAKEEKNMHTAVAELSAIQKKYSDSMAGLTIQYSNIMDSYQKAQDSTLKNLSTAEQEASRYWVACNQAMQNYLLEAAEAYQKFEKSNESSSRLLTAITAIYQKNELLIEDYKTQMKQFSEAQADVKQMMEEFGELLSRVEAAGSDRRNIYLAYADPDHSAANSDRMAESIARAIQESGRRQEAILEESARQQEEMLDEIRRMVRTNGSDKKKRGFSFKNRED